MAASSCSAVILNDADSFASTITGTPPHIFTASVYVTQYGAGTMASSPGLRSAMSAANMLCLAPLATMISSGA